jgi:hypothetical protein
MTLRDDREGDLESASSVKSVDEKFRATAV